MTTAQHIIIPLQTLNGGGVERVALGLAGAWVERGLGVTLAIGSRDGPLATELPDAARIVDLHDAGYGRLARAFPSIVRASGADIVFCPGNHYTAVGAWSRLMLAGHCPPIVAKVSNSLVRPDMTPVEAWGYRRWLRLHPRFLDALVAMTPAMAKQATAEMRMPAGRVHVIANPVPRIGPGKVPEGRYLLGVGRLAPQKRWDRAISALSHLQDRSVRLVIYGEGAERGALEALIARLGLRERVLLPGYNADPAAALADAVAVVLTSDFEGVPGVLREALAVGTPVITTESSVAVREIVASPDQGSVVAADDPEALIAALDHWLAPNRPRPAPVVAVGDPAGDYAALFSTLAS